MAGFSLAGAEMLGCWAGSGDDEDWLLPLGCWAGSGGEELLPFFPSMAFSCSCIQPCCCLSGAVLSLALSDDKSVVVDMDDVDAPRPVSHTAPR